MNEFDKEEHTEDIWYSQIREILLELQKKYVCMDECLCCFDGNYEKFDFCMELPIGLSIKPIKKHKG